MNLPKIRKRAFRGTSIAILLALGATPATADLFELPCFFSKWGVRVCEGVKRNDAQLKICIEESWDKCERLIDDQGDTMPGYYSCIEQVRCSCMARNGLSRFPMACPW